MKPVLADFKPVAAPSRVLAWLAVSCVLVACASGLAAWRQQRELKTLRAELAQSQAQQARQALPLPSSPIQAKPYERSLREMLTERALPWPDALASLEALAQQGVTPRAIETSAADGTVRVELTVTEPAKLLKYLDALNSGADKNANDLVWSLQQTQTDGATNTSVAILVGKRTTQAVAK
jgi:hypothetical protein